MENPLPQITVYGTTWCGDTIRARAFLEKYNIIYQWIDIDKDLEGRKFVEKANKGNRSVPTIVFADGSILVEPAISDLAKKVGV
jgi:mycoredoxin